MANSSYRPRSKTGPMDTHVIHSQLICPRYDHDYPRIVSGEGSILKDAGGRSYIDLYWEYLEAVIDDTLQRHT